MYDALFAAFGPQKWWPAQSRFEMILGAILTQSTNWGNVEKAIGNLRSSKKLSPAALRETSPARLARRFLSSATFQGPPEGSDEKPRLAENKFRESAPAPRPGAC